MAQVYIIAFSTTITSPPKLDVEQISKIDGNPSLRFPESHIFHINERVFKVFFTLPSLPVECSSALVPFSAKVKKSGKMSDKKNLLLLFDRPQEPIFMPKGDQKKAFAVPPEYLVSIKCLYN